MAWLTAPTPTPPGDAQPQPGGDGRWHIPAGTARLSGARKKNPRFVSKLTMHRFYFLFEHSKGQQVPCEGFVRGAEGAQALCLPC